MNLEKQFQELSVWTKLVSKPPTSFLKILAELILLSILGHLGAHGDVNEMI